MVGKRQGPTPTPLTVGHLLERLYRKVLRLNLARGSLNLNTGVL